MTFIAAAKKADLAHQEANLAITHAPDTERAILHIARSLAALSEAVAEQARSSHRAQP